MTTTLPPGAALLLIDVQQGFTDPAWGPRNNPAAEDAAGQLLDAWREAGWPVLHVQHDSDEPGSPLRPGSSGHEPAEQVRPRPGEPVLHKRVNSAFIGTDLVERLVHLAVPGLVVCGLTTDHCVSTTTRMAANLGWDTWLADDACATFDRIAPDGTTYPAEVVHRVSLASLHGEFAVVLTTDELLAGTRHGRTGV